MLYPASPAVPTADPHAHHRPAPRPEVIQLGGNGLSARARQLQPWCSTCGSPDNLTVDHTPAAWAKVQAGKRLTLRDFENGLLSVQCLRHNVALGHARGGSVTR